MATAFTRDSKRLATANRNGDVRIWDVTTHKEITRYKLTIAHSLAFSPDGKTLAVGGDRNGPIILIDMASRKKRLILKREPCTCDKGLVFSRDGKVLFTIWNHLLTPIETATGLARIRVATGHQGEVHQLVLSRDGKYLATAAKNGLVQLWRMPLESAE